MQHPLDTMPEICPFCGSSYFARREKISEDNYKIECGDCGGTYDLRIASVRREVLAAPEGDFVAMTRAAGFDPARHFRFTNWSGIDFAGCNLAGYDFTGANLMRCSFVGARINGARFDMAIVDKLDLQKADDWDLFAKSWKRPEKPVGDAHLPDGALFFEAPFAPAMVVIPAGRFLMGSTKAETDRFEIDEDRARTEQPRIEITIRRRFSLARDPITFGEFEAAGRRARIPSKNSEDKDRIDHPKTKISWNDANKWLEKLSLNTGGRYRLPSEAEWEYACRAGVITAFWWGEDWDQSFANGNVERGGTTPIGSYPQNGFGLRDMAGNVFEWCEDVWSESALDQPKDGSAYIPKLVPVNHNRVARGGSWGDNPRNLRSANRDRVEPDLRSNEVGFRPVRTLVTP